MKLEYRLLLPLLAFCLIGSSGISAGGSEQAGEPALSPRRLLDNLEAKKYSGRRIDLVFPNAGLQEVIAELEKAGGLRLDMDPSINDRVTYRMLNVPWDEALASVISDHSLHILLNLEGTGFKIGRGKPVVLALPDEGRAKTMLFLYNNLFRIAIGIFILSIVASGLWIYVRHRDRQRKAARKPLLPVAAAEQVKTKLLLALKEDRLYRDEDLSLQGLAEKLDISPHQLSWIINEELRVSFPTLVNGYRVEEVKSRLADPSFDGASLLQTAMEAGFNSKASFNRAFKIHTGMTPSEYKNSLSR